MKVLITENQRNRVLMDLIEKEGWESASNVFGGLANLVKILGKDVVLDYLMGYFDNLKLKHRGQSLFVDEGYNTIMEKPSSFWSSELRVYDSYLRHVLKEVPPSLYLHMRTDLIKRIIGMFPELSDETNVVVFEDQGLYKTHDKFKL